MDKEPARLEFFYIRHAHTAQAPIERHRFDVELSELGEQQVELLGQRFEGATFDAIFCSPMVRCVRTAAGLCRHLAGMPTIEIMPELVECGANPGKVCPDGRPGFYRQSMEYLKQYYPNLVLCEDRVFGDVDGSFYNQTEEQNDLRAIAIIHYLRSRFTYGQRIVVVAHGAFGGHFIPWAVGRNTDNLRISLNNTSVSKIKYTDDGVERISFTNDFSHLRPLQPDYEFTV